MKKESFAVYRGYVNLLRDTGTINQEVHDILFRFGLYLAYCPSDKDCFSRFLEVLSSQEITVKVSDLGDSLNV